MSKCIASNRCKKLEIACDVIISAIICATRHEVMCGQMIIFEQLWNSWGMIQFKKL
jgi:hypothetical protein